MLLLHFFAPPPPKTFDTLRAYPVFSLWHAYPPPRLRASFVPLPPNSRRISPLTHSRLPPINPSLPLSLSRPSHPPPLRQMLCLARAYVRPALLLEIMPHLQPPTPPTYPLPITYIPVPPLTTPHAPPARPSKLSTPTPFPHTPPPITLLFPHLSSQRSPTAPLLVTLDTDPPPHYIS